MNREGVPPRDTHLAVGRKQIAWWGVRRAAYFGVFWLVLSGHIEPLFVALGALSIALVCWLSWRAGLSRPAGATARFMLFLPRYSLWLAKEVLVSAVAVVRRVWSPDPALHPTVATTTSTGLPELAQVVYANSITLTPGTLSLEVGDDRIEVHSLYPAGVEALHAGEMLRRVRRLGA
jgi:multicomponent Na+:H+ antiporter subunit E